MPPVSQTAVPEARFLYVGEEWDDTAAASEWTGLRDPYLECFTADSACGPALQVTRDGRALWALPTAQQFSVDPESAFLISSLSWIGFWRPMTPASFRAGDSGVSLVCAVWLPDAIHAQRASTTRLRAGLPTRIGSG
ncbi:hypothetical protein [Cupriavidus taiwanensis]|uniref:hypothetical protein n=1 Tax=Cupriavidus taiwanensis TaxID=164546 RepID=UPI001F11D4CC|nr:hypothetical protein [Cupriavidus taiwanensis]